MSIPAFRPTGPARGWERMAGGEPGSWNGTLTGQLWPGSRRPHLSPGLLDCTGLRLARGALVWLWELEG